MTPNTFSYWRWFAFGSGGRPGFRRLVNRWLLFHALVGALAAALVQVRLVEAGNTVLLPLAGIFIGLSFAWAGNAQSILQTENVEELSQHHRGGFVEYVFVYQNAILVIIVTLCAWALAGLQVFDNCWPTEQRGATYFGTKALLFLLASLTLRECWGVVLSTHWLLLIEREMKEAKKRRGAQ